MMTCFIFYPQGSFTRSNVLGEGGSIGQKFNKGNSESDVLADEDMVEAMKEMESEEIE